MVQAIVSSLDTELVTSACLATLRAHHPVDLEIHLCAPIETERWAKRLCEETESVLHLSPQAFHHAEALQWVWDQIDGGYVALLDSDTTFHGPFLGKMLNAFDENVWAVGIDGYADTHGGFAWLNGAAPFQHPEYIIQPRIHPCLALLRRDEVLKRAVERFGFYDVLSMSSGPYGKCWDVLGFLGYVMEFCGYRPAFVPSGDLVRHWGAMSWHWKAQEQLPVFRKILKDYGYEPEEKNHDIERAF